MPVITYYISSYTFNNTSPYGYIEPSYKSYSTLKECGVYLYNSANGIFVSFPIHASIYQYSNFFSSFPTGSNLNTLNVSNDGTAGVGIYATISLSNNDDAYLVYPDYGLKVYNGSSGYSSTLVIDYYNSSSTPRIVRAAGSGNNNSGDCCKIYYKGVELI